MVKCPRYATVAIRQTNKNYEQKLRTKQRIANIIGGRRVPSLTWTKTHQCHTCNTVRSCILSALDKSSVSKFIHHSIKRTASLAADSEMSFLYLFSFISCSTPFDSLFEISHFAYHEMSNGCSVPAITLDHYCMRSCSSWIKFPSFLPSTKFCVQVHV